MLTIDTKLEKPHMIFPLEMDNIAVVRKLRHLGLIENPFATYSDARYFVPCIEHVTLYQSILRMSVENSKERIALIMGTQGAGKTILAKRMSNSVFDESPFSMKSVLIADDIPTPNSLVKKINDILGLQTQRSLEDRLVLLNEFITNNSQTGSGLFIVIDTEISKSTLKTLNKILNWTDSQGFPLAVKAVVFNSGNIFRFTEKIDKLNDIVGLRHTLGNLSFASASNLLESRVRMAGRSSPLFQSDALHEIVEKTDGHPGSLVDLANEVFNILLESNDESVSIRTVMEAQSKLKS